MGFRSIDCIGRKIDEMSDLRYGPILKEWRLYFEKAAGYTNRDTIMRAFVNFWNVPGVERLEIPGKCMLGGKVFNREGFNDGDEILTSHVKLIEKIDLGWKSIARELMCASTLSGSKYYFYSDTYNSYMFFMISDLIHDGKLKSDQNAYLKSEYHGSGLL